MPSEGPAVPLNITVSIMPQRYFVERVGGERVDVTVMVAPGASPATYEPKVAQLQALSRADAYVRIRVPFEDAWLDRFESVAPGMLIVDATRGIDRMPMVTQHRHGGVGAPHEQGEIFREGGDEHPDPHIWLSPRLAKIQAQTICDALAGLDPGYEADYRANLLGFLADIDELDAGIRAALEGLSNRKFMVFHPAWGYFARDYGLEMIPIEVGGQEPSAAELATLVSAAQAAGVRVVFAQPEFNRRGASTVAAEIGGEVLLISPLAPDWLDNLRRVARTFAEVLDR